MDGISPPESTTAHRWNSKHLAAALAVGVLSQLLFLPCLCQIGTAKITFAFVFDALVVARWWVANRRHETGRGWIVYAILCYTSAGWIEGIAYLIWGET